MYVLDGDFDAIAPSVCCIQIKFNRLSKVIASCQMLTGELTPLGLPSIGGQNGFDSIDMSQSHYRYRCLLSFETHEVDGHNLYMGTVSSESQVEEK